MLLKRATATPRANRVASPQRSAVDHAPPNRSTVRASALRSGAPSELRGKKLMSSFHSMLLGFNQVAPKAAIPSRLLRQASAGLTTFSPKRPFHTSGRTNEEEGRGPWIRPEAALPGEFLKKYCKDLTALAREGRLDPVIGREDEIRRTVQVLSRRTKNNPVLIGEPGVGKTAIVEGIAVRIVNGDVPDSIKKKKVMVLDLGQLVAGAKYRGEFEDRMKGVLKDVASAQGDVILFIDELHTLVGAGAAEGSMDASNLIKPQLARGELHCVGATTIKEYRKYIEKDAALARRFQPVLIPEPSVEDTITMMRGLKEKYEVHHGVTIMDEALVAAAVNSSRYIADRFLPDKAIDLIDEAASRLRLQLESKPEEIENIDRGVITLKIEMEALKKEKDPASKERLAKIEKELKEKQKQSEELTGKWRTERDVIEKEKLANERLEQLRRDLENSQRRGDWERAGQIRYVEVPQLEKELQESKTKREKMGMRFIHNSVTSKDIAEVVARTTGIPVHNLVIGEKERLLNMEKTLSARVIGQPEAVAAVSTAVRISRAGLHSHDRPLGVFLFLGPTGVGKTELCKSLAEFLFDTHQAMIRIDMSEYMEKFSVTRLIGAPPGYVGYEEGGTLTEAVRRRPYSLILFDEFEKAHREVSNLLLQVFDEGHLTDSQGRKVDFKNTIIIMTSNLGADILAGLPDGTPSSAVKDEMMGVVRHALAPEFLNRIDDITLFNKLSRQNMTNIVELQAKRIEKLLADKRVAIEISPDAKKLLGDKGYDPAFGARPLKRVIQQTILNPLATMIIEGKVQEGDTAKVIKGTAENIDFQIVKAVGPRTGQALDVASSDKVLDHE